MGLRFRKSIKIFDWLRVNFTKSGVGLSIGKKGMHYSVHSNGRKTFSLGIPGTGLYYVKSTGRKKRKK